MVPEFDLQRALSEAHVGPDLYSRYSELRAITDKTLAMGLIPSENDRRALSMYESQFPALPQLVIQHLASLAEAKQKPRKTPLAG